MTNLASDWLSQCESNGISKHLYCSVGVWSVYVKYYLAFCGEGVMYYLKLNFKAMKSQVNITLVLYGCVCVCQILLEVELQSNEISSEPHFSSVWVCVCMSNTI